VNPDLANAISYVLHGPPIRRLLAELHSLKLMARCVSRLRREGSYFLPPAPNPQ
jgi:hypothetical protein